ncbi:hypothetical protein ACN42_g8747 [Penicillium freii]|uniref:F-box domain-containing protein n=1 Tax=Penicillium freii TaxID=48697 RepID=A0A101MD61_PENFR|nr:hypothetical protein ACN42_g8747 [Penicillium freii]
MESHPLTGLLACHQEIIDAILAELRPNLASIAAVTRACHKLYSAATPSLYQSVMIWQPVNMIRFAKIIKDKPHLISFIRRLQVHHHVIPDPRGNQPDMFRLLDRIGFHRTIEKLVNLESLVIKADCLLPGLEMPSLCRRPEILPNLRSCNIPLTLMFPSNSNVLGVLGHYYSVWALWKIKPVDAALFHPNLENLTLTHCAIKAHTRNRPKDNPPHSTPLKRPWLLDCRIGATSLAEIMKYPRALKHITFKCESRGFAADSHQIQTRQRYVEAIKLQSSSLESLDLDIYLPWGKRINLTSLSVLRDLTITPSHLAGNPTDDDYLEYSSAPMVGLLPPSLEHLTFQDSNQYCGASRPERSPYLHEHFHLRGVYQLITKGELPHLSRFTCVLAPLPTRDYGTVDRMANISLQIHAFEAEMFDPTRTFTQAFYELGVRLYISQTDHSVTMPENDEYKLSQGSLATG